MLISAEHVFDFCFSVRFVNALYCTFASMLIDFFVLSAHFIEAGFVIGVGRFVLVLLWRFSVCFERRINICVCFFLCCSIVESISVWVCVSDSALGWGTGGGGG